jgi:hypothetical protein
MKLFELQDVVFQFKNAVMVDYRRPVQFVIPALFSLFDIHPSLPLLKVGIK